MENNEIIKYEGGLIKRVSNLISVTNKLLAATEPQLNSYIKNLSSKFTDEELSCFPGNNQLKYEAFSPIFKNLFQNKIVYSERFIGLVKLEDVVITPERFKATAIPYLPIERKHKFDQFFFRKPKWTFGSDWQFMRLIGNSINVPYANWTIWFDPETIKLVEELIQSNKMKEALAITLYEND